MRLIGRGRPGPLLLTLVCAAGAQACATTARSPALDAPSAATGPSARPAPDPPAKAPDNPFAGARFYIDPGYVAKVEAAMAAAPRRAALLLKLEAFPTAVWLDSIAKVPSVSRHLQGALAQQNATGQPVVTVFVVYDLPERDCAAQASSGELGQANDGERRYVAEFLEPIAAQFRSHPSQRIAVIVEPDSLANVATNLGIPRCAAAEAMYRRSIARAIRTLALPNVALYLDAAHAGWLGWRANRSKIAHIYHDVLVDAGGPDRIRGFATNVSNYDSLHPGDIARLEPSDPCPDELTYVARLSESLAEVGVTGKGFVVDTSRNGRSGIKTRSGSWCNIKGAGLGERPQASPAPGIDAYYWVKPPGDSDGASTPGSPGYDPNCAAEDSAAGAPPAGQWFQSYFLELAENATPPL